MCLHLQLDDTNIALPIIWNEFPPWCFGFLCLSNVGQGMHIHSSFEEEALQPQWDENNIECSNIIFCAWCIPIKKWIKKWHPSANSCLISKGLITKCPCLIHSSKWVPTLKHAITLGTLFILNIYTILSNHILNLHSIPLFYGVSIKWVLKPGIMLYMVLGVRTKGRLLSGIRHDWHR